MESAGAAHAIDASGRERGGGIAAASAGKIGMWVFLATDAMGFGGLLLAYALLRVRATSWPDPAVRFDRMLAGVSTFVLLGSGATMTAALAAARAGNARRARRWLLVTAALGLAFAVGQAVEFRALVVDRHIGLATDHAAGLFFVITGYHGLHVLAGIAALLGVFVRARQAPLSAPSLEVVSLYWQFVDLVWIVIFTAVYLVPSVQGG